VLSLPIVRRLFLCSMLAACGGDDSITPLPVADAGFDRAVQVGDEVELDGSASSSPDGAALAYRWSLLLRPTTSTAELVRDGDVKPRLTPDVPGDYLVTLIVANEGRESSPDLVAIAATNEPPLATATCRAGSSCRVAHGKSEALDGRATRDPDGDALRFVWAQVLSAADCSTLCPSLAGCNPYPQNIAITDATSALATFSAPDVEDVQLVFRMDVSDGSSSDSACLRYITYNTAPIILSVGASAAQVDEGTAFTLTSSSDDSERDALTFLWEQCEPAPAPCLPLDPSTPVAVIADPTASSPSVTAPSVTQNEQLRFRVTVTDGFDTVSCTGSGCSGTTLVSILVRDVL
jgi:hypothetical protein